MTQPHDPSAAAETTKPRFKVSFIMMIAGSIITALLLVIVSMYLYNKSGAAQLDLSLPGLQEERQRAQQTKRYDDFSQTGKLDSQALTQFDNFYSRQQADILRDRSGFDPATLGDQPLGIQVE